jgi:hypothetical protein
MLVTAVHLLFMWLAGWRFFIMDGGMVALIELLLEFVDLL